MRPGSGEVHLELLVEEPSTEAALHVLVPRILYPDVSFATRVFQGKHDLLNKLPCRLRGYRDWLPPIGKVIVLIDEDREDCRRLKQWLEDIAASVGLSTKASPRPTGSFAILNRVAVEELEAWFFGDVPAMTMAFPGVPPNLSARAGFRDPDAIRGGTWEALERVLQRAGYFPAGLSKTEAARRIALHMDPESNRSRSFQVFRDGLRSACRGG